MNIAAELKRRGIPDALIETATERGKPIKSDDTPEDYGVKLGNGIIEIVVYGTPLGKPRMTRQDKWKKRPRVVRYWDWSSRLKAACSLMLPTAESVTSLDWTAYFEPPKSWSKKKRCEVIGKLHRAKPDRDNIDKAVLDSLFKQDSGIAKGTLDKCWGWTPRIEIIIRFSEKGANHESD